MSDDLDSFEDDDFGDGSSIEGGPEDSDPDALGDAWLAANDPDAEPAGVAQPGEGASGDPDTPAGSDPTEALLAALGLGGPDEPAEPTAAAGAHLAWRETYYVIFSSSERPTLTQVEGAIADSGRGLEVENLQADEDGLFQSVLVQSPGDNSALEISFERGEAVVEQSVELAKTLQETVDGDQLAQLMRADARLDIMHFERVEPEGDLDPDDPEAMNQSGFDPATLITVVEALAHLTGGLPVDPVAGELLI